MSSLVKYNSFLESKKPYELPYTPTYTIKLDIVETLFPQCPQVIAATRDAIVDLHRYPSQGDIVELTALVSKYTSTSTPIIFTNGSDNALKLIADTFFTPSTKVCIVVPTYPHFIQMAENTPAKITYIKCKSEEEVLSNIDAIVACDIVYISSPNLPYGYMSTIAIKKILESKTIVIADEAYYEYGSGTVCDLLKEYDNLIVVRTFSKFFGLAALRLGYLTTSAVLCDLLKIMHNGKNITKVATVAATVALKNAEFYREQLIEFNRTREYIKEALSKIVDLDKEIYGFNIQYGNFLLLYARDTKKVTQLFGSLSNIAVRDKHSEIANAIRLSIAPINIMEIVVNVVKYINKAFTPKFIIDLDGTIRANAKLSTYIAPSISEFIDTNGVIVTNNTVHSKEQIRKQLKISEAVDIIQPNYPSGFFIVDRQNNSVDDVDSAKIDTYEGIAIMNDVFNIPYNRLATLVKLLKRDVPIVVAECNDYTTLDNCSETDAVGIESIPDIGSFLKMMKINKYTIVGKPNVNTPTFDVIGDASTDELLAKKLGTTFIKVDPLLSDVVIDKNIAVPSLLHFVEYMHT